MARSPHATPHRSLRAAGDRGRADGRDGRPPRSGSRAGQDRRFDCHCAGWRCKPRRLLRQRHAGACSSQPGDRVHAQYGRGLGVDRARPPRPRHSALHRLCRFCHVDRRRLQADPARPRRRDDHRRQRGGDHPHGPGRLRRDARPLDPQRRPARASRPFDRDRDGFVLAEGRGILILEELEQSPGPAARRIYAELLGYGMSADALPHHRARRAGPRRSARHATRASPTPGLDADDVDYINAHGTSTRLGDLAETARHEARLRRDHARTLRSPAPRASSATCSAPPAASSWSPRPWPSATDVLPPTINLDHPGEPAATSTTSPTPPASARRRLASCPTASASAATTPSSPSAGRRLAVRDERPGDALLPGVDWLRG